MSLAAWRTNPGRTIWSIAQRLFSGILLLALSPLIATCCLAIKLESDGPCFFMQKRVGKNGQPLWIPKLRSMRQAAETRTALGVRRDDAAITRIGSVLRRLKIDELPQLWCVVKGDLALVGPRPLPTTLDETLCREIQSFSRRREVLPGLTSLAQLVVEEAPNDSDMRWRWQIRSRLERHGMRHAGPKYDLVVLFLTAVYLSRSWARAAIKASAALLRRITQRDPARLADADYSSVW